MQCIKFCINYWKSSIWVQFSCTHRTENSMTGLRLAQIYMDPETMVRYDRVCKLLHWSESGLVRQAIAAYFKVHLDYYVECSYRDLEAREMAVEDWYTTLRDKSIEELPRYKRGRPAFGPTPRAAWARSRLPSRSSTNGKCEISGLPSAPCMISAPKPFRSIRSSPAASSEIGRAHV